MSKKIKNIILVIIYVVSLILVAFLVKNITMKKCKDSEIKLEEDLNKVTSKMSDVEKHNKMHDLADPCQEEVIAMLSAYICKMGESFSHHFK